MVQLVNKNTFSTTYKDDYADSDNFYRILFNSGRKLQARELTQSQTILQKQIERMGNNLYEDNTLIKDGTAQIDNNYEFIRLNTTAIPIPTPQDLVGAVYTGQTSNIQFTVDKVVEATGSDPLTLYGKYTNTKNWTGTDTTATPRAEPGETMTATSLTNIQVESATTSVGRGSRFVAGGAIYYSKGFFVFTDNQEIIISKYTNTPTAEIGFKRIEETVSSDDDADLYDNQGSEPNITAPGADRYRIRLQLVNKADLAAGDDFIFRAYVNQGVITSSSKITNSYNIPAAHVAERIFENSGDYLVKPFGLEYTADSQNTHLLANITDGIAVVQGFRSTRFTSKPTIRVKKAIDTVTFEDQLVATPYGNYFEADSMPAQAPRLQTSTGYDQQIIKPNADFGGAQIGTCYVRHIERQGDGTFHIYVFDLLLNDGSSIDDIGSIGISTDEYFNINNNSRNNGPFTRTTSRNNLIYPLPIPRAADITNADLTVQRQFEINAIAGNNDITTTGSETFVDTNVWTVTDKYGNRDSALNASFGISLLNSNQTARLTGLTTGEDTRITAYVRKPNVTGRSKTVIEINETLFVESDAVTGLNYINLAKADIIEVTHIEDPDDSDQSYFNQFSLDDGRRDNFYANGKLIYLDDSAPNDMRQFALGGGATGGSGVRVRYRHFQHAGGSTFFDKTSYDGQVDYADIPVHTYQDGTQIRLTDALDFRPTMDASGQFETSTGGSINELPKPTGVVDLNVSYYVPRADKLTIDKNGQLNYIKGVSAYRPTPPSTPDGEMALFEIYLGSNTLDEKDLRIKRIDHKRYTMSQIGLLEKRLARLEELTTLTLLEAKADNFQVYDANGLDRTRSGFVVDNFTSHAYTDFRNLDHRAAIDLQSGIVYPRKVERTLDLLYDSDDNNSGSLNCVLEGGYLIPTYEEEVYMENDYTSGVFLLNPFQVNSFAGTMELAPASDTWYETAYAASKTVNYLGSTILSDGSFKWNDWEWNWKGKTVEEIQVGDTTNKIETVSGRTTTTSWNVVEDTYVTETFDKDVLVKSESIPTMRSKLIRFRATGLQPNANMYAFFNNVSVDNWVRAEDFSSIDWETEFNNDVDYGTSQIGATEHPNGKSQLTTDANGVCEGSFFIPSTPSFFFHCGTLKFELKNVTGVGNQNYTSRAITNYTAAGTLQTFQKNYTSTRYVKIEGDNETYTAPLIINSGSSGSNSSNDNNWTNTSNTSTTTTTAPASRDDPTPVVINNNNDKNESVPITSNVCYTPSDNDDFISSAFNDPGSLLPPSSGSSQFGTQKENKGFFETLFGWLF